MPWQFGSLKVMVEGLPVLIHAKVDPCCFWWFWLGTHIIPIMLPIITPGFPMVSLTETQHGFHISPRSLPGHSQVSPRPFPGHSQIWASPQLIPNLFPTYSQIIPRSLPGHSQIWGKPNGDHVFQIPSKQNAALFFTFFLAHCCVLSKFFFLICFGSPDDAQTLFFLNLGSIF
jgi:hypothetical protein